MEKRDLKKELSHLYNPSQKDFSIVDVPTMNFLMVDGKGDTDVSRTSKINKQKYILQLSQKSKKHPAGVGSRA